MQIKIVYFGTPEHSSLLLEKLIKDFERPIEGIRFLIQSIVTSPDKPIGRKQVLTPSYVSLAAQKNNISILKPEKLGDDFITPNLSLLESDLFIVASYGKIIPKSLLDIPKFGAINVHPSLLPKYRGASPIQNTILNGDRVGGITLIKMDPEMDHGPILRQKELQIDQSANFETLANKMFLEAEEIIVKMLPEFVNGKIIPKEQDHSLATFTKIIKKEGGYFDLPAGRQGLDLEQLDRMVRAYYPWPTAWTRWKNKVVKLLPNQMVQMEGKKPTKIKEFLNGYPDFPIKSY